MKPEITGTYLKNLAAESSGISAAMWEFTQIVQESPSWHPVLRGVEAAVWGFCGFEMPVTERLLRENRFPSFSERLGSVHAGRVIRDMAGFVISTGIFFVVGQNSGDWLLATGAHLLSRFILNGVVNLEWDLTQTSTSPRSK